MRGISGWLGVAAPLWPTAEHRHLRRRRIRETARASAAGPLQCALAAGAALYTAASELGSTASSLMAFNEHADGRLAINDRVQCELSLAAHGAVSLEAVATRGFKRRPEWWPAQH